MTAVEELTLWPIEPVPYDARQSIDERFEAFAAANPHIERALIVLARQWMAAGNSKVGMKALWERLRWEFAIQTGERRYLLNNDYTSRYARRLAANCPDLADAFNLRELRS